MTPASVGPKHNAGGVRVLLITVEKYHRMIQTRILPEGGTIELLDGFLFQKDRSKAGQDLTSVGAGHAWTADNLGDVLVGVRAEGCRLRLQQPVILPPDGEPEPDGAIVRDVEHRYRAQHPGPADAFCVIEVADSSLDHDRTTKLRIYAEAGITQYVIINLVDRTVEVYREPRPEAGRYGQMTTLSPGQDVEFFCGQGRVVSVPVAQLLP